MNKLNIIIGVAIVTAITVICLVSFWKKPKNDTVVIPTKQEIRIIYLKDSTKAHEQDVLLTNSKNAITFLQDSLTKLFISLSKIEPTTSVNYTTTSEYTNKLGKYQDSLSGLIDSLIYYKQNNSKYYDLLLSNKKFNYSIQDKWFSQQGDFDLQGNIKINKLKVKGAPFVVIGEKGKWYQRPTITALVGDENPNIAIDSLKSYMYVPKRKIQLSGTGIILTNGKQTNLGVGLNIKKGPISLTIGYQLTKQ